jgi:cyclopropane-fatty-acyl-phospholipid synthase
VEELGLSHKISFLLLDYRVAADRFKGQFDRVVSIEMVEAVGVEFLPTYACLFSLSLAFLSGFFL